MRSCATEVRLVVDDTGRRLAGRDMAGSAATLTFFAGIAIVPWLLWALWSVRWFDGVADANRRLLALRVLIPPQMGARPVYDALVDAGTHVGLVKGLALAFPASFYGEGLRRACRTSQTDDERFTGWRSRVAVLALLLVVPPLAWVGATVGGHVAGIESLALRVYLGFLTLWVVLSVLLTWVYCTVTPGRPRWWVSAVGALTTGSFVAGFAGGFVLFLSLPIDVGIPYAGLRVIGAVVAAGLWMWVAHMIVIAGWAFTRSVDARVGSRRARHASGYPAWRTRGSGGTARS